jgi:penicillin-binding protein 1C
MVLAPILWLVVAAAFTPLPEGLVEKERYSESVRYVDREGVLLREVRADDAARARWIPLGEVGENAKLAMLAAEDKRFFEHPGVDPLAMARAAATDAWARRIVSGGSTLTMQLARLMRPHPRNTRGKLGEMALALRIEASLSKDEVFEEYMNRAPFGPNLRGIDAASRFYFDKPPVKLSLAEAATLAAIPRGPEVYGLAKHGDRALRRRDRILARMLAAGWITQEAHDRAASEPLDVHLGTGSFGAPHFVQALQSGAFGGVRSPGKPVLTTIERGVQREAEQAATLAIAPLAKKHVTAASIVVLDNQTGDILAYVGSPSFSDAAHGGQNDGVRAHRQPGSTLKPFLYGLAMERLGFSAATPLPDVELDLDLPGGVYSPRNYDEHFHGPVRLREALGSSLNVPAVWTANELGTIALLDRLRALGMAGLAQTPEFYGPALALGDGEVTLLELSNAYATLARGGLWKPVHVVRGARSDEGTQVMPADVAAAITDILKDRGARLATFGAGSALELPFEVAAKTGTSKGFRDNWTVGYTPAVTVGVWVGNFDGSPMEGVSGITGAAPLFQSVMEAAMRGRPEGKFDVNVDDFINVEICPLSGGARTAACPHGAHEHISRKLGAPPACTMHERVAIDRRNGLRAGPGCPRQFVDELAFERFDGPYAAWAKGARRDTAPPDFSPLCPARGDAHEPHVGAVRVGWPHDGARFAFDPDRPRSQQTLAVRMDAPNGSRRVELFVDGRAVGAAAAPYVVRWELARGEHVLVADAPGLPPSEPVRVRVD